MRFMTARVRLPAGGVQPLIATPSEWLDTVMMCVLALTLGEL
ncbi:hypothetical protein [Rothia aeria]|uniref:Uncharacterized protein n=1 Tax=Rothia aeria F0474 TaxID=1125724 RepID=I0UUI1_9MICC|nr:hypothetical protein [Rothia aeria]EID51534.1 hypothetical protein HMPREF1324_1303 [Rothia aeria F0474]